MGKTRLGRMHVTTVPQRHPCGCLADVCMDARMLGRTDVHMEVRVEVVMDIWTDVFTKTRMDVNTA